MAALELEHLVYTTGTRKRWLLSKNQRDYGVLTYKQLKCVPLSCPRITCALEIDPSLDEMKPWLQGRSLDTFRFELKPLGEAMLVDSYLLDPNRFACDFEGEEAEIRLFPTYGHGAED